ncbi:amidase domain-containing protein [Streptomyces sp. NPDC047023]|uniref:amidase domain-containing protein n=1 Tax=Streptomyces sp. NPDC047023 TaxID=3155139 RepID=UPI0033E53122
MISTRLKPVAIAGVSAAIMTSAIAYATHLAAPDDSAERPASAVADTARANGPAASPGTEQSPAGQAPAADDRGPDKAATDTGDKPRPMDKKATDTFAHIADQVLAERTQALVEEGRVSHGSGKPELKAELSAKLQKEEAAALDSLRSRRTVLARLGEQYSAADTRVSVDQATVAGSEATVRVTERTVLTYKKVRGNEPQTTDSTTRYELRLSWDKKRNCWLLNLIRPQETGGPISINEPTPVPRPTVTDDGQQYPTAKTASTQWPAPASRPKALSGGAYDYRAMAQYAEKHWKSYNPAYRNQKAGGDCTNFTSQALLAGGWKPVPGSDTDYRNWWYDAAKGQSQSWVGANEWSWFTLSNQRTAHLANVFQADIGDIVQMDFNKDGSKDHSMIVTYKDRAGMPYLTYHSTDTYRRSLASIIASYPTADYFAYRT